MRIQDFLFVGPCLWHAGQLYLTILHVFDFFSAFFSSHFITKAKDAEQVNKNIKKQCWNVWYEAYLLTSDETSPTSPTASTPATPSLSPKIAISSYNFDNVTAVGSGLKKSRKVYCYISKKVICLHLFALW